MRYCCLLSILMIMNYEEAQTILFPIDGWLGASTFCQLDISSTDNIILSVINFKVKVRLGKAKEVLLKREASVQVTSLC